MAEAGQPTLRATAYRHSAPALTDIGPALLEGSRRLGGRFNARGEFGVLYLSLDPDTTRAELVRRARRAGIDVGDLLPRSLVVVHVDLRRVLDLTDPAERDRWGLDDGSIRAEDHAACQEIGRAARREGYEAIQFPSATSRGANLAVFLDRLHPGSEVRGQHVEHLALGETGDLQ